METGLIALAVFALFVLILLAKIASARPRDKGRRRRDDAVDGAGVVAEHASVLDLDD
jgi:hypothetical protein